MDLNNNTILITGGGSGIGLSLAAELLKYSNKIIICGRDIEKLKRAKKTYPALEIMQADVSNEDSVKRLAEEVQKKHPGLNFLINNAGIMKLWNIQKKNINISTQKAEILTNVFGTIQLTQSLIPHLLNQENSFILNVSSALAFVPMAATPIYNATKAALHSYSISVRQQLEGTSIKVFELLPAAVETQMAFDVEDITGVKGEGRRMSPEKLASLTVKGLKNDTYEIRPGMANLLYHIHRFFPAVARRMIENQSKKLPDRL